MRSQFLTHEKLILNLREVDSPEFQKMTRSPDLCGSLRFSPDLSTILTIHDTQISYIYSFWARKAQIGAREAYKSGLKNPQNGRFLAKKCQRNFDPPSKASPASPNFKKNPIYMQSTPKKLQ